MMYKKAICIVVTILVTILSHNLSYADNKSNTLIIYENKQNITYKENTVDYLEELLYKFNNNVEKVNLSEYKKAHIDKFDYVVVVNIENDISNSNIIEDLSNYNGNIYWIGNKIENLLDYNDKYNIEYDGKNNNINKIIYKDNNTLLSDYKNFN
ncbi:hypothetical protein, partial [Romboutsia sp.]|uniref:hypothetical protein n=1 Tax=Romboutsia sp. TaxID=1965302 RepID=UPI003F3B61A3